LALAPLGLGAALAAGVVAGGGLMALRVRSLAGLALLLVLGGAWVGELRLDAIDSQSERIEDGRTVALDAYLVARPRPSAFGASAEITVAGGPLHGARLLLRLPRWVEAPRADIGAELALEGRLRSLDGREPSAHSFDWAGHHRRRGIAGEFLADRVRPTGGRRGGLAGVLDRMRERAERAVSAGLSAGDGALVRGMVLGQDEAIDEAVRQDFRDSGLAHLLAVSGQNVMLLAALALPLLAAAGLGPRGRGVALLILISVYVPLAGAGPSLQRAGVMGAAGIAAMTLSRPASRWYALCLAAVVTLALNPRACGDPGWQLSFAAVGGILVLGPPLREGLRWLGDAGRSSRTPALRQGLVDGLAEGAALTVAATVATAPLLAYHFDAVSLAALPANLVALPAVAPAMWLGMLKAAFGQVAFVVPVADEAARALGPLAAAPVSYLELLAARFADVPGGRLVLPLRDSAAVALAYAGLATLAALLARGAHRLGPRAEETAARWRRRPRVQRHGVVAGLIALACLSALAVLRGPGPPGQLTVRFLDVGQGDATLVQHPDGTAVLFDGGPPEGGVARLLRKAGVRRLALVVATHSSRDHHGGLAEVLERYPVDLLLDGGDGTRDHGYRRLLALAAERGVRTVDAVAPMRLAAGEITVDVLSPLPRGPGPPPEDPNPRAVVALVRLGGFELFLSADAESESLLPLDLPDVDAMKVPHHGSSDPGLPEVLERLRPELAAIEVGPNTYGHPAPPTLAALRRAGAHTFRTDRQGTVALTVENNGLAVETER
jgi:competence protein ComEC